MLVEEAARESRCDAVGDALAALAAGLVLAQSPAARGDDRRRARASAPHAGGGRGARRATGFCCAPGVHAGPVVIDKPLTLEGERRRRRRCGRHGHRPQDPRARRRRPRAHDHGLRHERRELRQRDLRRAGRRRRVDRGQHARRQSVRHRAARLQRTRSCATTASPTAAISGSTTAATASTSGTTPGALIEGNTSRGGRDGIYIEISHDNVIPRQPLRGPALRRPLHVRQRQRGHRQHLDRQPCRLRADVFGPASRSCATSRSPIASTG